MTWDSTQLLTTVLTGDSSQIHLAASMDAGSHLSVTPLTLCCEPVECRVSTQNFHRRGCPTCAEAAVRGGITSIFDRRQAAVNLPRFLAAMGIADVVGDPAPPVVPSQRDGVQS